MIENEKSTIKTQDNIEIYENEISILCDDFINGLHDPDDIYNNKRLLPDLFKYLYNNYVCNILNNKYKQSNRYNDFILLDNLWDIFSGICHRYNSNVTILMFSIFTNISRENISRWNSSNNNNNNRELTPEQSHIVKKWFNECELDLVQGSSVFDIFMLKSNFNYNDNIQSKPDINVNRINVDNLPLLGENNDIM